MKRETLIWTLLMVLGLGYLVVRGVTSEHMFGTAFVKAVEVNADAENPDHRWTRFEQSTPGEYRSAVARDANQTEYRFSLWRTLGIWVAAFFTLAIFSFLYKDNPFYKIAESVVVGVSAAYWMVIGFWDTIEPNLIGKLFPAMVQAWARPGLGVDAEQSFLEQGDWFYLIPLALGVMLLWRLAPKGGWISRWPMAFIIGVFCGLRLITFLHADFLSQIRNSIVPLWVTDAGGAFDLWASLRGVILIVGVLTCLVYFFFSIEHKGVVGHTAKVGIWFLMVTFGAAFGYTVMGRIALLAIRLEFLFDDWLWLIDPTGKRAVETVSLLWYQLPMLQ
ncbi:MAG: hypothetical protein ACYTG1_02070 [Planctomycetota bacterium]|jgi:hypothetical protein